MKKLTILLMIASSVLLVERAEAGLVWNATATLSVIPRPGVEGIERVRTRGVHRVTITDMGSYVSLEMRVQAGSLEFNSFSEDLCSSPWVYVTEVSTISCTTAVNQAPCDDGIWEAVTKGKLKIASFFNKTKIGLAAPRFINCGCT